MTPQQKLWLLRLASLPALLLVPPVCAAIAVVLADRFLDDSYPLGWALTAALAGLVAAIGLSFLTLFARRTAPWKRSVRVLAGLVAFDLLGLPLGFVASTPVALADRAGQKPDDVIRAFISAIQVEDYEKAASFFKKQSLDAIRHNSAHGYDFRTYCAHFRNLESYRLDPGRRGKGRHWNVGMSGQRRGEPVGYQFYLAKIGGKWLLVASEGSSFWDEPEETQPHARLRILTYRFNSDTALRGAGRMAPVVLVHRIDHERAMPVVPIMAESDGSFLLRVRPGEHQIEYEEIKGKPENQDITYSTVAATFEEGRTYTLNGHSIVASDGKPAGKHP